MVKDAKFLYADNENSQAKLCLRLPIKPVLGEVVVVVGGGGMGMGFRIQPRKLHCRTWRDFIKPSLRFSFFCVFFVSKGNLLDFHSFPTHVRRYVFSCCGSHTHPKYSRTSMVRTSLGPWKSGNG